MTVYKKPQATATAEATSYQLPPIVTVSSGPNELEFDFKIPAGYPGLPGKNGEDAPGAVWQDWDDQIDFDEAVTGPQYLYCTGLVANGPTGVTAPLFFSVENNESSTAVRQRIQSADGFFTRIGAVETGGWAEGHQDVYVQISSPNNTGGVYDAGYLRFDYDNETDVLQERWVLTTIFAQGTTLEFTQNPTDAVLGPNGTGTFTLKINHALSPGNIVQIGGTQILTINEDGSATVITGEIQRDKYYVIIHSGTYAFDDVNVVGTLTLSYTGFYQNRFLDALNFSAWSPSGVGATTETFLLTGSGTFTPTRSGIAKITCVGGGGAGGSIVEQTALLTYGCSGGSSGGIVKAWVRLDKGSSYTYLIGAGGIANGTIAGATTFGDPSIVTAPGGVAGLGPTTTVSGDEVIFYPAQTVPIGAEKGEAGGPYVLVFSADTGAYTNSRAIGGAGGSSRFGIGGARTTAARGDSSAGNSGTGYGSGGGGASATSMSGTPLTLGGNGASGCIEIVMMYDR